MALPPILTWVAKPAKSGARAAARPAPEARVLSARPVEALTLEAAPRRAVDR